jgi:hypothetical protein
VKNRALVLLMMVPLLLIGVFFSACKQGTPSGPDNQPNNNLRVLFLKTFDGQSLNGLAQYLFSGPVTISDTYVNDGRGGFLLRRNLSTPLFNPYTSTDLYELARIPGLDQGRFRISAKFAVDDIIDNVGQAVFGVFFINDDFSSLGRAVFTAGLNPIVGQSIALDTLSPQGAPSHAEAVLPGSFDPTATFLVVLDANPDTRIVTASVQNTSGALRATVSGTYPNFQGFANAGLYFSVQNTPRSDFTVDVDDLEVDGE